MKSAGPYPVIPAGIAGIQTTEGRIHAARLADGGRVQSTGWRNPCGGHQSV